MEDKYIPRSRIQLIRKEKRQTILEKSRQQINVPAGRKKCTVYWSRNYNCVIKRMKCANKDAMMILIIFASFKFPFLRAILRYRVRLSIVIRNYAAVNYFLTSTKDGQEGKLLKMMTRGTSYWLSRKRLCSISIIISFSRLLRERREMVSLFNKRNAIQWSSYRRMQLDC